MQSKNIEYLPSIDHLRGMAALLILYFHNVSWLLNFHLNYGNEDKQKPIASNIFESLILEGHTAVTLFIVLSGFIFTAGCYKKDIIYTSFLKNRLLRTYPLYIFLLIFGFSAYRDNFDMLRFLSLVFPFANMTEHEATNDFGAMFWTVAVEWQFYLVFPFLIAITNKVGYKYLFLLILTFIVFRNIAYTMEPNINIGKLGYTTIAGRMDQFLIGMLIGVYYKEKFKPGTLMNTFFIASVTAILITLYYYNIYELQKKDAYFNAFWPSIEGALWAVFILGYISISKFTPKIVAILLSSLGIISYSVYLCHYMIIMLILQLNWTLKSVDTSTILGASISTTVVTLPLVLIIATITYHSIEKPFLGFRTRYSKLKFPNSVFT